MSPELEADDNKLSTDTIRLFVTSNSPPKELKSAMEFILSALEVFTKLIPWLILLFFLYYYHPQISDILESPSLKLDVFGFKLEKIDFDRDVQRSIQIPNGYNTPQPTSSEVAFNKLKLATHYLKGMQVLWFDNHPEINTSIIKILKNLSVQVVIATDINEAKDKIKRNEFDLVISHLGRDESHNEDAVGVELAKLINTYKYQTPFLFYTGEPNKVPPKKEFEYKQVIANDNPSELLCTIAEIAFGRRK